ncbi:hypothetical protein N7526_007132 [Penicillium atrosanguineum]|nr:hypothetical protein N7526_007132 [Penicillium atrosanguineum]
MWWGNPEQRRQQKERIKNKIKQTKSMEKSNSNQGYVPISYGHYTPYEIDVKTERQTFVDDVPLRHDSSVSTFSALGPAQLQATLPTFPAEEWLQEEYFDGSREYAATVDPAIYGQGIGQTFHSLHANIPVNDYDRPLLDHFVENVLRMIFPILEVHQQGSTRARAVLQSLETNKSYFHCCLSVAAIHLKTSSGLNGEQIDHDIMRHRYEAISELCQALSKDSDHENILDATLAMIFFHCSVGAPDDYLPDIPWSDHFQAVTNLVSKLGLTESMEPSGSTFMVPPFSMSLTSWIDILGSTMLGRTPQFAHSYRNKHLSGTSSGLRELMGCDDRVMYLISEISCLESLKNEGRVDTITVCTHVSALGKQLEYTEAGNQVMESPYSPSGVIRPDVLTKNMTIVYRLAARIYLCSLVPGADRSQSSTRNLVTTMGEALAYIPAGPCGFDRSLVWPLLIGGAFSLPSTSFRQVLTERIEAMGDLADFGSFGRMFQLLKEYWRLTDDPVNRSIAKDEIASDSTFQITESSNDVSVSPPIPSPGMREIKKQQVHWRDIMNRNGWRYLLI